MAAEMMGALTRLGWRPNFAEPFVKQWDGRRRELVPARVFGVWRRSLTVVDGLGETEQHLGGRWFQSDPTDRPVVGDWVLLDARRQTVVALLGRENLLERRAAGRQHERQPIAANVDTLLLVTSCNEEFNRSRLERFLALALEASVRPVVVLTKADLAPDPAPFRLAALALKRDLEVHVVDARDEETLHDVRAHCGVGQTVALLGSSGVGKSTLVNSLAGASVQLTGAVRAADAKGRHTTTRRSLHVLPSGGLLLDTPGLRELNLGDVEFGVSALFEDIADLAAGCRFANCRHDREPSCAVRSAVDAGTLDPRRLESFRKLRGA
ncbi:MAG: ribosome small subunit-dependent GTPase A [Pseudomonadales bacterium]